MKKADLIKLFLLMGMTQANAEKCAANTPDDGPSTEQKDIDAYGTEVRTAQMTVLKNDPDYIKTVDEPIRKKYEDIQFRKLKQTFGVTQEEIKDMDYEAALKYARDKVTKSDNKTLDELQNKNIELEKKLKDLEETTIPGIKSEVDQRKEQIELEAMLRKNITPKDKKLRVSEEAAIPALTTYLASQGFKLKKGDDGNLEVVTKDGLKPMKADKSGTLTFAEIRDTQLDSWGMVEVSGAPDPAKGKKGTITDPKGKGAGENEEGNANYSPHLAKARENLEKNKEFIAENKKQ